MPLWRKKDDDRKRGERPEDWERGDLFDDPFFDMRSDLFRDFDDQFRRMRAYMDAMMEKAASGELKNPGEGGPFVYGWSMKVGPDGVPHVQTFGNVRPQMKRGGRALPAGNEGPGAGGQGLGIKLRSDVPTSRPSDAPPVRPWPRAPRPGPLEDEGDACRGDLLAGPGVREPLTDICDGEKEVTVIAEMPGIEKDDIELETGDDLLVVKVDKGPRKYYKELPLGARVVPDSARAKYNNGVLEITLRKAEDEKRGTRVKVE